MSIVEKKNQIVAGETGDSEVSETVAIQIGGDDGVRCCSGTNNDG